MHNSKKQDVIALVKKMMATDGYFNFTRQDLTALQEGLGRIDIIRDFYVDGITAEEIVNRALENPPAPTAGNNEIKESLGLIDAGITLFNADKGFKVSSSSHSDWLVFDQRSVIWKKDGLEYLMQIFPQFDEHENILSWTLYGVVSYDTKTGRYLQRFSAATGVPLNNIALNIAPCLVKRIILSQL